MPDIVITEFMDETIAREGFGGHDFHYEPTLVDEPDRLRNLLGDARAIVVRNRTQIDAALLAHAPNLKVVGRLGVGLDNIDLTLCRQKEIEVCPALGANDISVAEYVITAALVLLRGAWGAREAVALGDWPRGELIGREISGLTLGCIGFGSIAREAAKRAKALGMGIAAFDPYIDKNDEAWINIKRCGLSELLGQSDVISLHTPLNDQTRRLIDDVALQKMKKGSVLINAARGGIVDEDALARALKSGHLGGAALDVFENEPLTADTGKKFAKVKNLLLTPHIAGVTQQSNRRVSEVTVRNVLQVLEN